MEDVKSYIERILKDFQNRKDFKEKLEKRGATLDSFNSITERFILSKYNRSMDKSPETWSINEEDFQRILEIVIRGDQLTTLMIKDHLTPKSVDPYGNLLWGPIEEGSGWGLLDILNLHENISLSELNSKFKQIGKEELNKVADIIIGKNPKKLVKPQISITFKNYQAIEKEGEIPGINCFTLLTDAEFEWVKKSISDIEIRDSARNEIIHFLVSTGNSVKILPYDSDQNTIEFIGK